MKNHNKLLICIMLFLFIIICFLLVKIDSLGGLEYNIKITESQILNEPPSSSDSKLIEIDNGKVYLDDSKVNILFCSAKINYIVKKTNGFSLPYVEGLYFYDESQNLSAIRFSLYKNNQIVYQNYLGEVITRVNSYSINQNILTTNFECKFADNFRYMINEEGNYHLIIESTIYIDGKIKEFKETFDFEVIFIK